MGLRMAAQDPNLAHSLTELDSVLAKLLLVRRLSQVPEFQDRWDQARKHLEPWAKAFFAEQLALLRKVSPEGRAAFVLSQGVLMGLHSAAAQDEARGVITKLRAFETTHPGWNAYLQEIEALTAPLRVQGLAAVMAVLDLRSSRPQELVMDESSVGRTALVVLEAVFMEAVTGFRPLQLATEGRGSIRRRAVRTFAPVRRHLSHHELGQRIDLWMRHVVYDQSLADLSRNFTRRRSRSLLQDSTAWVKKQLHDANSLLGHRRPGRPRKGGVLAVWKPTLIK